MMSLEVGSALLVQYVARLPCLVPKNSTKPNYPIIVVAEQRTYSWPDH